MSTFSNLTLRQLCTLLPSTEGTSTPSEIWIGSNPTEILCSADLGDSRIEVYKNGFYTYTRGSHTCILRVDGFTRLCYDAVDMPNGFVAVEEHEYLDYPYFVALSVNGENQWERNQQKRTAYNHDFYIEDDGCNAFDAKRTRSQPMSFWTEQDVLEYLYTRKIPYASVYGDIILDKNGKYQTTGVNRAGCMFGCYLEKAPNRFQQLAKTHPKIYDYCIN